MDWIAKPTVLEVRGRGHSFRVMRRITDDDGSIWDVLVGRASWGVFVLLFVPVGGASSVASRQWMLEAEAADQAERALAGMSEEELKERLRQAGPREA